MLSPLSLKVFSFLFSELPVKGEKLWDDLLVACSKLLGELREEGLTPLIYMQLLYRNQHHKLPPAFLRELSQDYASALKTAARQDQAAGQVIKSFHQAGIDFLLLKGADLRIRLYGDASLRPMSDLDLLTSSGDISSVRSLLENLGFSLESICADKRPGFRQAFENELEFLPPSADSLMVDVHWEITGLDQFYRLSFAPLWNKSVLLDFQGIPVRVLSPEHALTHLCLHAFKEDRVIHLIDLVLALRTFSISWPCLLDEVEHFRCQAPVYLILQAMAEISPVLVPESVLKVLSNYQPTWAEKLVLHRTLGCFTGHFSNLYHHRTFAEWFLYMSSVLWPQRDYLVAIYGKPDRVRFVRHIFKILFSSAQNRYRAGSVANQR